jgi:hypothetical protein
MAKMTPAERASVQAAKKKTLPLIKQRLPLIVLPRLLVALILMLAWGRILLLLRLFLM